MSPSQHVKQLHIGFELKNAFSQIAEILFFRSALSNFFSVFFLLAVGFILFGFSFSIDLKILQ